MHKHVHLYRFNTNARGCNQAYNELFKVFLEAAGIQDIRRFPQEDIPAIMRTAGACSAR